MRLSRRGEYALKALLHLAQRGPGAVVSAAEMAERERIPEAFLQQILLSLAHAGFLRSRRGRGGGFLLGRAAGEVVLGDVTRLLDGPLAPIACASVTAYAPCPSCLDPATCRLRGVMSRVRDAISDVLDRTTLADLSSARAPSVRSRPDRRRVAAKKGPAR